MAASLVALAAAGWIVSKSEFIRHPLTTGIAVLPFENLSDEKEHEFFADGVQDDILTETGENRRPQSDQPHQRDAISRQTGCAADREATACLARAGRNVRAFWRQGARKCAVGGHSHRRRQSGQRNTTGDLNDVFAIETEVAQSIANRLRAKVSAREKLAMQERPTKDLVAYDLYYASRVLDRPRSRSAEDQVRTRRKIISKRMELLNQAIARDPTFVLAYCRLAEANDEFYLHGFDRTPRRLELAKSAIDSAFRLKPDSGEAHLALAALFLPRLLRLRSRP